MKKIYDNKKIISIIGGIVILILSLVLYLVNANKKIEDNIALNVTVEKITTQRESFYVDVKGNVNNPGVYIINPNETINHIIKKAGGLKKDSYTDNINLSKIVTDEMVIYIHSNKEINKIKELNNCKCEPIIKYKECNDKIVVTTTKIIYEIDTSTKKITDTTKVTKISTTTKKDVTTTKKDITSTKIVDLRININTATLEELISLNGLGESKAKKIIEYRNNVGLFESEEDLLKVDGIGFKTFENIKEYIKV